MHFSAVDKRPLATIKASYTCIHTAQLTCNHTAANRRPELPPRTTRNGRAYSGSLDRAGFLRARAAECVQMDALVPGLCRTPQKALQALSGCCRLGIRKPGA